MFLTAAQSWRAMANTLISNLISFRREYGTGALAVCILCKLWYRALAVIFDFHPWHASAPYACRPYKEVVVRLMRSLGNASIAVEIGCGLGDIISRAQSPQKFGFDLDGNAVRAAAFLHPSVQFSVASLDQADAIRRRVGGFIDVLVMVNWPDVVEFGALQKSIKALKASSGVGYLLIDTIRPHGVGYHHYHSVEKIAQLGKIVASADGRDGVRDIHVIRLS
jgi:hypothetical protein